MPTVLRELLGDSASAAGVVGAAIAVVHSDSVQVACFGKSDRQTSTDVTEHTTFKLASITKPMVAIVLARLVALGRLGFDDAIDKHVPELAGTHFGRTATVRQLLANTSGVGVSIHRDQRFSAEGDDCLSAFAVEQAQEPAMFEPGTNWSYSNTAWALVGRVLETVGGLSWEEMMRRECFAPASMQSAAFDPTGSLHYVTTAGEPQVVDPAQVRALGPAGGTVWASIHDMALWAQSVLSGVAAPADLLSELREVAWKVGNSAFVDDWCHGLARFNLPGGPVWGWDGIWCGHRTIFRWVPDQDVAIVLLTNTSSGRQVYRGVFPEVLKEFGINMPGLSWAPPTSMDLASYEGSYAMSDLEMTVAAGDDGLFVSSGGSTLTVYPNDRQTFMPDLFSEEQVIGFGSFDDKGRPAMAYSCVWGMPRTS